MKVIDIMADDYSDRVESIDEHAAGDYKAGFKAAREMIAKKLDQFIVTQHLTHGLFLQEKTEEVSDPVTLGDMVRQVGESEEAE